MKFKAKVFFNHRTSRILAIPADQSLDQLPEKVRQWIGTSTSEQIRELDTSEALIGLDPTRVSEDFQAKGWSACEVTVTTDIDP